VKKTIIPEPVSYILPNLWGSCASNIVGGLLLDKYTIYMFLGPDIGMGPVGHWRWDIT
jgi:hypothetical protein